MRSINKQDKKTAFLFSAYVGENEKQDEQNHINLVDSLNRASPPFPFKVVERVHTFNHDINETKPLVLVEVNEECQRSELFEYVKNLCISHNQSSLLEITPSRVVIQHTLKGERIVQGNLRSVPQEIALSKPTFIFDQSTDSYFIAD